LLKFAWKNRNVFDPVHDPPRFQTRLMPLSMCTSKPHLKNLKMVPVPVPSPSK